MATKRFTFTASESVARQIEAEQKRQKYNNPGRFLREFTVANLARLDAARSQQQPVAQPGR